MRKILIPVLAAASLATGASAASMRTEVVPYGDLDISTEAGRATLEARISGAVERVCGKAFKGSLAEVAVVEDCRAAAMEDAMAQVEARLATLPPPTVASAF